MAGREDIFQKAMSTGHSAAWDRQWSKAAESYQKALDEFPQHPKALANLGLALFELQRFDESLQAYQKAAQAAPTDPLPLEKVGQLSERVGKHPEAIQSFLQAAELYIKNQEADKALENWTRVTQLDPEHIPARSYLAMVHERLGHLPQATTEYLLVASLFQRTGKVDKAAEMIGRALHLSPNSQEARQAQLMLKGGQLLPKPMRSQGGTAMLKLREVKELEAPDGADTGLDPVAEATKKALSHLAAYLFDLSDEPGSSQMSKRGMQAIVRGGTDELNLKQSERTKIMLHLGQAIEAQTRNQEAQAAGELEKALSAGFIDPALSFDLGLLCSKTSQPDAAIRHLKVAVKHEDYALGTRLLLADLQHQAGRLQEAVTEYMEALKIADSGVVAPEQVDAMRQLYEPLLDAIAHQTDPVAMEQLCRNVKELLQRPYWRAAVLQAREQLPKSADGTPPMPLAEILAQAQSGQVIEGIGRVRLLARDGHLRSAMDEAFESLKYSPTYLPLHTLIGDLLIQEGHTQEAIAKYTVVAEAYSVRGEATQAVALLRRIIQVAPMDLAVRTRLIDQLAARGMVNEAVGEYIDMADIYYRLAELELARKTYTTALRLAQQGGANRAWSVKLMRRMADIDMQRLDYRQAIRLFEQLRTLEPDDVPVRKNLVDLNIRLNQQPQAAVELENFLTHFESIGRQGEAVPFLEDLIKEIPGQGFLRKALAEEYRRNGRIPDAVAQLDTLGDLLLAAGDRSGAIHATEAIIAMNPPNMPDYQSLLVKLKSEA